MRRFLPSVSTLLVLAAMLALLPAAGAQLKTATAQELGVVKILLAQEAAWNKGDIDGFGQGLQGFTRHHFHRHPRLQGSRPAPQRLPQELSEPRRHGPARLLRA